MADRLIPRGNDSSRSLVAPDNSVARTAGKRRSLGPSSFAGHVIFQHSICGAKALRKLTWFLRDFGYDVEVLGRDEVDETKFVGLKGVVKASHIVVNGSSLLRLDGFVHSSRWEQLSPANLDNPLVA